MRDLLECPGCGRRVTAERDRMRPDVAYLAAHERQVAPGRWEACPRREAPA